jgi:hypothetical protein
MILPGVIDDYNIKFSWDLFCFNDAIDRAHFDALRLVEISFTFYASIRINDIDFIALADGVGGAFRFTSTAGDAFFRDFKCHDQTSLKWVLKVKPRLAGWSAILP